MIAQPALTLPALTEPTQTATPADDAAYYRDVLHALIDVGVKLVKTLVEPPAQAAEPETPAPLAEIGLFYDRVTRAVRRCINQAQLLRQPLPVPVPVQSDQHRAVARRRIIRKLEDIIERDVDGPAVETLHAELLERMEQSDLDDEIDTRPVADIIEDIRRDMGLAPSAVGAPFKRRTPGDVAELCARAAGSPNPAALGRVPASATLAPNVMASVQVLRTAPKPPPDSPVHSRLSEEDALLLHRAMRYREP